MGIGVRRSSALVFGLRSRSRSTQTTETGLMKRDVLLNTPQTYPPHVFLATGPRHTCHLRRNWIVIAFREPLQEGEGGRGGQAASHDSQGHVHGGIMVTHFLPCSAISVTAPPPFTFSSNNLIIIIIQLSPLECRSSVSGTNRRSGHVPRSPGGP